jgi:hypothetical protein
VSGLHYAALQRVPKTRTRSAPMPSRVPAPRQRQTFGLLKRKPKAFARIRGIRFCVSEAHTASLPSGHPAWPPAPITGRASDGLLRSVRPFSVTLGRHCTPRPSYRVDTTYAHTTWPNRDVSLFGPAFCLYADRHQHVFAGSNSRRCATSGCSGLRRKS